LEHVRSRREVPWLIAHFKDPRALVPGSKMPNFADLPDAELHRLSDYLLALP
jgi:cbb3-type cytochrome oxidase cytochrome c subunit